MIGAIGGGGRRQGPLKSHELAVTTLQRLADAFWITVAHYGAVAAYPWFVQFLRRTSLGVVDGTTGPAIAEIDVAAIAVGIVAFYVTGELNGLYRSWRGVPVRRLFGAACWAWFAALPVLLFLGFITKTSAEYSRLAMLVWFVLTPALLVVWRGVIHVALRQMRSQGRNTRSVAIAGCTEVAMRVAERIKSDPYLGMKLVDFYDDRQAGPRITLPQAKGDEPQLRGDLTQLVEDARNGELDIVYIGLPLRAEERINQILKELADTTATVYVVADFHLFDLLHAQWSSVGDIPVVSIFDSPFNGLGGWIKRLEDLVVGSVILTLIALPMLVIAAAIKLTSRGPIFFRQTRYGLNGSKIKVLKFRTMTVCEDGPVIKQAQQNDARITRLGGFLRRISLDELPQFIQVLTGEMSIVGPRPHAVAHNELYRSKILGYMLRHKVKPGITGWAQVNGWRGETDVLEKMQKRVEHDLDYIRNWNVLLDLRIIWLTVFGSKTRRNAF